MNQKDIIKNIKLGKIFIYPTDTIYGLGCDATNVKAVDKIKEIKNRDKDKPLSVIAPSIEWIKKNLIIDKGFDLEKYLPGPYTLILKKKNKDFLKHISKGDSLGVRIPDIYFTKIIQNSKVPFVTTSVNLAGKPFVTKTSDIPEKIKCKVDVIVDKGVLSGKPSTLVVEGKKELNR
ncbi:MAG: L-threonylcarbamoyladenylate synthase [archaeon]